MAARPPRMPTEVQGERAGDGPDPLVHRLRRLAHLGPEILPANPAVPVRVEAGDDIGRELCSLCASMAQRVICIS